MFAVMDKTLSTVYMSSAIPDHTAVRRIKWIHAPSFGGDRWAIKANRSNIQDPVYYPNWFSVVTLNGFEYIHEGQDRSAFDQSFSIGWSQSSGALFAAGFQGAGGGVYDLNYSLVTLAGFDTMGKTGPGDADPSAFLYTAHDNASDACWASSFRPVAGGGTYLLGTDLLKITTHPPLADRAVMDKNGNHYLNRVDAQQLEKINNAGTSQWTSASVGGEVGCDGDGHPFVVAPDNKLKKINTATGAALVEKTGLQLDLGALSRPFLDTTALDVDYEGNVVVCMHDGGFPNRRNAIRVFDNTLSSLLYELELGRIAARFPGDGRWNGRIHTICAQYKPPIAVGSPASFPSP
jgi:hypothetical protein